MNRGRGSSRVFHPCVGSSESPSFCLSVFLGLKNTEIRCLLKILLRFPDTAATYKMTILFCVFCFSRLFDGPVFPCFFLPCGCCEEHISGQRGQCPNIGGWILEVKTLQSSYTLKKKDILYFWGHWGLSLVREDHWFTRGMEEAIYITLEPPSLKWGRGLLHHLSPYVMPY